MSFPIDMKLSTIVSEGFKGGTRGALILPRDAVSRTANVERTNRHKWVNGNIIVWNYFQKVQSKYIRKNSRNKIFIQHMKKVACKTGRILALCKSLLLFAKYLQNAYKYLQKCLYSCIHNTRE